jgi:SAM-dependent methyltransferase
MKTIGKNHLDLWGDYYKNLNSSYLFPNEYVVRTFLGMYPNLRMNKNYRNEKICDVGCGDGRNITALHKFGFDVYATEVSEEVCRITKEKLLNHAERIDVNIQKGLNDDLPFKDEAFDYLLSWNACYYLKDEKADIDDNLREHSRVLKKGGYFIVSVPGPNCFSLQGAEVLDRGRVRLQTQTKWDILNGQIIHRFNSYEEIESKFGVYFNTFQKGMLVDDCYGLKLEYYVFVCQKK